MSSGWRCRFCRWHPRLVCWQEHASLPQSSVCNGGTAPRPASLAEFCDLKGDATQERLEGERPGHHCPPGLAWPGLAVAHACLLTLEVPTQPVPVGTLACLSRTLRLRVAAQRCRAGPPLCLSPPGFPAAYSSSVCRGCDGLHASHPQGSHL